jgi:anti-sigma factor RsiW
MTAEAMNVEERLIAYVDGALPAPERAAFETEMAADPALAARVEQHRRLAARVSGAYAPVLEEPVPPHLTALAGAANDRGPRRAGLPRWAAMAASLALGVLAGRLLWPDQGPLATHGGDLVARGGLETALTTKLASDPGPVKVGLTFRSRDGRYCRTFASPADRLAGLACRRDGRWVAQTTTAWAPQPSPDYRTAASAMPPAVLAAVDATLAGEAFDAAAERAARDRGWKR